MSSTKAVSKAVTSSKADKAVTGAVAQAVAGWNGEVSDLAVAARQSALATFRAFEAGMVGVGKHYGSQRDYAALFLSPNGGRDDDGKPRTIGQTTVIMWRRVGSALDKGADEQTITRLFDGAALDGRIGKALDEAKSATAIRKAVNSIYGRNGKVTKKADPAPSENGATTAGDGTAESDKAPAMPRNNSGRLDMLETVRASLTTLSKAERKRLLEHVEACGILLGLTFTVSKAEPEPESIPA